MLMVAILAVCAVVVVLYIFASLVLLKPKTGGLRADVFGGVKHLGPGWHFLWRPFQWLATVNDSKVHSVQKRVLPSEIKIEAENEESGIIVSRLVYRITDLARYLDFSEEDFKKSIVDHLEGVATDLARACKDLNEIYEKVENGKFESDLLACFRKPMPSIIWPSGKPAVGEYHGVAVDSVVISDVKLPEEIEKAALEEEVAKKRAKAQNQEMLGVKRMAQLMVRQSKRNGDEMTLERAMYLVQRQFGKVDSVEEFGLSPATLKTIEKTPSAALPIWATAFLNRLSKANSGKRYGPRKKGDK